MKSHLSFGAWNVCPLLGFAAHHHVMQLSLGTVPSSTVYKHTCTTEGMNQERDSPFYTSLSLS